MTQTLALLTQIANGFAKQFGPNCEIVIHDLTTADIEHSIIYITNGNVTNRQIGNGPSKVVLETLHKEPDTPKDHLNYLTRTPDGRILKSSTMYIRGDDLKIHYILSINYDITNLLAIESTVKTLIDIKPQAENNPPEQIVTNVNDLLDSLIEQSVRLIGKPVALMTKDEKVAAIQFLNDAGAFLITKSGDKVSTYFGISKFTLYSYIDINK